MAGSTEALRAHAAEARPAPQPAPQDMPQPAPQDMPQGMLPADGAGQPGPVACRPTPLSYLTREIGRLGDQFGAAFPAKVGLTPERFMRIAVTALRENEDLQMCNPMSILGALVTSAQLGLEPNTPIQQAYLVPRKGQCVFWVGYRGYLTLAHRSGDVASVTARTIYSREVDLGLFDARYGTSEELVHSPILFEERGAEVGYYAVAHRASGGAPFVVLSRADIERIRLASPAPNSPAWKNWYDRMAWAKCIRTLARFLPLATELQLGAALDETVRMDTDLDAVNTATVPDDTKMVTITPEMAA